jgi:hypothetical protein
MCPLGFSPFIGRDPIKLRRAKGREILNQVFEKIKKCWLKTLAPKSCVDWFEL